MKGHFKTELNLSVEIFYEYSYEPELPATMHDPGSPGSEEIIIDEIYILGNAGKVTGKLPREWLSQRDIEDIEEQIKSDACGGED